MKKKQIKKDVVKVTQAVEKKIKNSAAVQERLSLELIEVANPMKFPKGIKSGFSGYAETDAGVVQELSFTLPGSEPVDIPYAELNGNVFTYNLGGEDLTAMMYQVGRGFYMITMTNGPFKGTRMKFKVKDNDGYYGDSYEMRREEELNELGNQAVDTGYYSEQNEQTNRDVSNFDQQQQQQSFNY